MNLHPTSLRYFITVAELGSFRRASEALNIAASAVNRQVKQIEESLGVPLFERRSGRNSLRLTAAGEMLLLHARAVMNELKQANEKIEDLKGLRRGNIALGVPETFIRDFVPTLISDFRARHSGITIDITVEPSLTLLDHLLRDAVDVVMTFNPPEMPDLFHLERLARVTYAMMRADHPLAGEGSVRIVDCARYPLIMPAPNSELRIEYDRVFGRALARPEVVVTTSSYEMMRSMARAGIGIALVSRNLAPLNRSDDAGVVYVPVVDRLVLQQHLVVSVRRSRHLSLAAAAFIDFLRTQLGSEHIEN